MPRVKAAKRRPLRWRNWLRLAQRYALGTAIAAAAAGAFYGGYRVWHDGVIHSTIAALAAAQDRLLEATARAGLGVQEITVAGRNETAAARVLDALGTARGAPILAFSPAAAKAALEALPWVKRAAVERRFPGAIHVELTERQPLALWQRDGRLVVIDRDGEEIRGVTVERFAELPVMVGDDAPKQASVLMAVLATEPALRSRVDAAIRVSGRRWNIRLDNGVEIELPEENPASAWARLAALDRQSKVLDGSARVVDLRLPDRFVVRLARDVPLPGTPADTPRGRLRPQRQI